MRILAWGMALLLAGPAFGQIDREKHTVQVVAYWEEGDTQTYQVTTTKSEVRDDQETLLGTSSYLVDIKVLSAIQTGYTVEWRYHDLSSPATEDEAVRKLSSLMEGVRIVVSTNEFGELSHVENWKEVSELVGQALEVLRPSLKGSAVINAMLTNLKAVYSTQASIESSVIPDIQQFYSFFGSLYEIGESYTGKSSGVSPLGGAPISYDVEVSVAEDEVFDKSFVVRQWSTADAESTKKFILGFLRNTANLTGTALPDESQLGDFLFEDRTYTQIHAESGWPLFSGQTREVTYQGVQRLTKRTIEIQD